MPDNLKQEMYNCQKVNHDFQHYLWSEKEILPLLRNTNPLYEELYVSYERYAQKADLARYVILYVYGGIYLDADMVCYKNLSDFCHLDFFLTAPPLYKIIRSVQNCIIGSEPNHPFISVILQECVNRRHNTNIMKSTGPKMIYDAMKIYGKHIPIIDRKYLYPCQPYDDDNCPYTCEDCYVAHMANASWYSSNAQSVHKYLRNNKMAFASVGVGILWLAAVFA